MVYLEIDCLIRMDNFDGMTVNERLYVGGLIDKFDLAVRNRQHEEVREILLKVHVDESSIKEILKNI